MERRICASRSRGPSTIRVSSRSPVSTHLTVAAASSRSFPWDAKRMPRLVWPTPWPARPIFCRAEAMEKGVCTRITWSSAPTSMPSSRELVATMAGRRPFLHARLHHRPDLARQGTVVGVGQRRFPAVVDQARQALGQAAVVGEDQGGAGLGDAILEFAGDNGPDVHSPVAAGPLARGLLARGLRGRSDAILGRPAQAVGGDGVTHA